MQSFFLWDIEPQLSHAPLRYFLTVGPWTSPRLYHDVRGSNTFCFSSCGLWCFRDGLVRKVLGSMLAGKGSMTVYKLTDCLHIYCIQMVSLISTDSCKSYSSGQLSKLIMCVYTHVYDSLLDKVTAEDGDSDDMIKYWGIDMRNKVWSIEQSVFVMAKLYSDLQRPWEKSCTYKTLPRSNTFWSSSITASTLNVSSL